MKLSRVSLVLGLVLLTGRISRADDIKNNFQANLNQDALNALARDLGAVTGGGSFHQGKALGFPLGFDVGVHAAAIGIKDSDPILHDDTSTFGSAFGQVEVGLPFKLAVIGRGGSFGASTVLGGGLRYGLIDSSVPGIPKVSLIGLYDHMSYDLFTMDHYSANAVISFDLPIIRPYLGAGWDSTKLNLTDSAFAGVPASVDRSLDGSSTGYRVEGGVNLSLIPFTYLTLGGGLANGAPLYHLGLGAFF